MRSSSLGRSTISAPCRRNSETGPHVRGSSRDAPFRSQQRERNDQELSRAGFANAKRWGSSRWPSRSGRLSVDEQDHQINLATVLGEDVPM